MTPPSPPPDARTVVGLALAAPAIIREAGSFDEALREGLVSLCKSALLRLVDPFVASGVIRGTHLPALAVSGTPRAE